MKTGQHLDLLALIVASALVALAVAMLLVRRAHRPLDLDPQPSRLDRLRATQHAAYQQLCTKHHADRQRLHRDLRAKGVPTRERRAAQARLLEQQLRREQALARRQQRAGRLRFGSSWPVH